MKSLSLILIGYVLFVQLEQVEHIFYVPDHFPEMPIPAENEMTLERIELGRRLFFDPILSRDSSLSCGGCHVPHLAFTDGKKVSEGIFAQKVTRNSPTLLNVGYQTEGLLFDKGVPSLEMQVVVPIHEKTEFDFNVRLVAERMKRDTAYVRLTQLAYNQEPSPLTLTNAIAAYERTLVSGDSKYDRFINGDLGALSKDEQRGMKLFFEDFNCDACHGGFLFTNLAAENNGLYNYPYPIDSGRMRLTGKEEDRDLFKVPTLRNIELTGPYMHDGSITSLEDVLDHYSKGGADHPHKSDSIAGFVMDVNQRAQMLLFLKALTDTSYMDRL